VNVSAFNRGDPVHDLVQASNLWHYALRRDRMSNVRRLTIRRATPYQTSHPLRLASLHQKDPDTPNSMFEDLAA
jgi:hypothetical protein